MINQIQAVIDHCRANSDDFFEGISLCEDWADLTFGNQFTKVRKNFFRYISIKRDDNDWGNPLIKSIGDVATFVRNRKWDWEEGVFTILKAVHLTAVYAIITCRDMFQLKIKSLSKVEWIADAANVSLKIKELWDKDCGTGFFEIAQDVGSGLSVAFSVVKLFETKKSVVFAWMDVSLSTALFVSKFFKAEK
jgi:hypothetical protein